MRSQCGLFRAGRGQDSQPEDMPEQHGLWPLVVTSTAMGNSSSHKRTKASKQAGKERPRDMDEACWKELCSGPPQKKPSTKVLLLFTPDKRRHPAEEAVGLGVPPRRLGEDASGAQEGTPTAAPMLRGAGDGAKQHDSLGERDIKKILVGLLLQNPRLHEVGRHVAGAPGTSCGASGGAGAGSSAQAAQGRQPLYERLLTYSRGHRQGNPAKGQPRKWSRCPRPRP